MGQFVKLPVHAVDVSAKLDAARYIRDPGTTGAEVLLGVPVGTAELVAVMDAVGVPVRVTADVPVDAGVEPGVLVEAGEPEGVTEAGSTGSPYSVDNV